MKRQASVRLSVASVAGIAAAALVGTFGSWEFAPSAAWVCAAVVFLVWTWSVVAIMDADQTAAHATQKDPSRSAAQLLAILGR